jgi:hypothetical protein
MQQLGLAANLKDFSFVSYTGDEVCLICTNFFFFYLRTLSLNAPMQLCFRAER